MHGRLPGLMIVAIIYIIGIVSQIASVKAWYQYWIGRIISGMGVRGIAVYVQWWFKELAPNHLRDIAVSFYQINDYHRHFLGLLQ